MRAKPSSGAIDGPTYTHDLHRLWWRYGAASAYLALSSFILGFAHYHGGALAIGIMTILGSVFEQPKIIRTPVLASVQGLTGLLEVVERLCE